MKRMFRHIEAVCLVVIAMLAGCGSTHSAPAVKADFYVSTKGNDSWSGRLPAPNEDASDGPFATLARARNAVRRVIADGLDKPITVLVRGGNYYLKEPVLFDPHDSGTKANPITYAAYPGETPVFTGGRVIPGWKEQGDGVWTAEVPEVKAGRWYFRQLFVKRPERGYYERRYRPTIGALTVAGLTNSKARESMVHARSQKDFRFYPGDIQQWEGLADAELVLLHSWTASRLRIANVDPQQHVVTFTGYPFHRVGFWWKGGRNPYYIENVAAAFRNPGEWYLNRQTGVLAYRPLPGEDMSELKVVAPRLEQLIRLVGDVERQDYVEYINFRGLGFSHTEWPLPPQGYGGKQGMIDLPAAIQAVGARHCRIERCAIARLGAYGLEIGRGCHDNVVVGNRFSDLGAGGIKVGTVEQTAAPPIVPTGNVIANNLISDGGLIHFSSHGIWVGTAADTHVHHNLVRRFLYSGMSIGYIWEPSPRAVKNNIIEYNHIHHAMLLLADGGGIYTLGFQPGTVLRGNLIHDIPRHPIAGGAPNNGIFCDAGSKGYLIEENVIYNTSGEPIRFNENQREGHTLRNNYFGVKPSDPGFPEQIANAAGLQPEYRWLDGTPPPSVRSPVLAMNLARVVSAPTELIEAAIGEDFEDVQVGEFPASIYSTGEGQGASVRVTDETAASGRRSLKFIDAPNLPKPHFPYVWLVPQLDSGRAKISFALRYEPGASVTIEGRDTAGNAHKPGPFLNITAGGVLVVAKQSLLHLPPGQWCRFELTCSLGAQSQGTYDLTVTLPGQPPQRFAQRPYMNPEFRRLDSLMILSTANQAAVFYVDDVKVKQE
ncbi:MAG: right-handed parallel beta-helix repeat-containing protein [Armatimonadota bacterium]|nr:right-handed parallel beta-helix repeat-containing protein [Armatimonadota bacterium]